MIEPSGKLEEMDCKDQHGPVDVDLEIYEVETLERLSAAMAKEYKVL